MPLEGKHNFGSINETRVTFVEKAITKERCDFLQRLLEYNGFEVLVEEAARKSEEEPQLYTLGVTDIVFNPTIWIYQRKLKTFDGQRVTPGYWEQRTEESNPNYWNNGSAEK